MYLLRFRSTPVFFVEVSHSEVSKGAVIVDARSHRYTKTACTLIHLDLFFELGQLMLQIELKNNTVSKCKIILY